MRTSGGVPRQFQNAGNRFFRGNSDPADDEETARAGGWRAGALRNLSDEFSI
jgi:hypothetical protein